MGATVRLDNTRIKERARAKKDKRRDLERMRWRLGHKAPTKGRSRLQGQAQKSAKNPNTKTGSKGIRDWRQTKTRREETWTFFSCMYDSVCASVTQIWRRKEQYSRWIRVDNDRDNRRRREKKRIDRRDGKTGLMLNQIEIEILCRTRSLFFFDFFSDAFAEIVIHKHAGVVGKENRKRGAARGTR